MCTRAHVKGQGDLPFATGDRHQDSQGAADWLLLVFSTSMLILPHHADQLPLSRCERGPMYTDIVLEQWRYCEFGLSGGSSDRTPECGAHAADGGHICTVNFIECKCTCIHEYTNID